MTIGIIDYGSGNLHSVAKAFQLKAGEHGATAALITTPDELGACSHVVLPGVGAFGDCVAGLRALDGMWEALSEAVLQQQKPFFGICVGMQMMLERGFEHGEHSGLGWIAGDVVPLFGEQEASQGDNLKIPHMGWNELSLTREHPVLRGIESGEHVYFVHSFHAKCADANSILATTDYGATVTACIGIQNMIGTQFHPEKSGAAGLRLIENFITWDGRA